MNSKEKTDVSYRSKWPCGAMPVPAPARDEATRGNLGFTLVELLVVLAVLAILASIAITSLGKYRNMARNNRAMSEIRTIENAIAGFRADRGFFPPDLNAVNYGTLLDPWGHNYQYAPPGTRTFAAEDVNTDFDLWSSGENGVPDPSGSLLNSPNAIIRTHDGGRVGMAYKYGTPDY